MKKIFLVFVLAIMCLSFIPSNVFAENLQNEDLSINAKEAVLMGENGQIVYSQNGREKRPIASMTKIMTLLCIYDDIDSGKIKLTDDVVVSSNAASMGGSQVFLDANATYKVENLIKSIVICSANDSCVALAEHTSGSVSNFVARMNKKANELGLVATHFENCTGLPNVSQYSCAEDVSKMLCALIKHPHYFVCAKTWLEDFEHPSGRTTEMANTNKLIRYYDGCDGGKTGFTNESMFCLAATAKRNDTRLIAVVVGAPDSKTRFAGVSSLFNYGFANYESKVYIKRGDVLGVAKVSNGKRDVEYIASADLAYFGKKSEQHSVSVNVPDTLSAPISTGSKLGSAELVDENGNVVATVDLVAKNSVEAKTYFDYIKDIIVDY